MFVIGCLTIAHFTLLRCAAPKPRYWPGSCDGTANICSDCHVTRRRSRLIKRTSELFPDRLVLIRVADHVICATGSGGDSSGTNNLHDKPKASNMNS
jgi:hypothetical protein